MWDEEANKPIILPTRITMDYALEHSNLIFLYGNDVMQRGCFGQSSDLGSQRPIIPNCFRIPTLVKYCANPVFFQNSLSYHKADIDQAFDAIPKDGRPIIPLRRIGQGHSRCQELAPIVYKYIKQRLDEIAYPKIIWRDE